MSRCTCTQAERDALWKRVLQRSPETRALVLDILRVRIAKTEADHVTG